MLSGCRSSRLRESCDEVVPDPLHLIPRRGAAAAVVNHPSREHPLIFDGHLRRDHRAGTTLIETATLGQSFELEVFGHVDEKHCRIEALETIFKKERNVVDDDLGAALRSLRSTGGHPIPNEGVNYRIQTATRFRVVEHQGAQPAAVDLAVANVFLSELADDGVESGTAWRVRGVRPLVGVNHRGTPFAQHRGDR